MCSHILTLSGHTVCVFSVFLSYFVCLSSLSYVTPVTIGFLTDDSIKSGAMNHQKLQQGKSVHVALVGLINSNKQAETKR